MKIGQGCCAALADQVVRANILAQPQPLQHVPGQAGADVPRAGADHHGIDLSGGQSRFAQRALRRLGGQHGRMRREARRERIGIDGEHVGQRVQRQPARLDAVIALQYRARYQMGAGIETTIPVRFLEGRQALGLGVSRRRGGSTDSAKVHGSRRQEVDRALCAKLRDLHCGPFVPLLASRLVARGPSDQGVNRRPRGSNAPVSIQFSGAVPVIWSWGKKCRRASATSCLSVGWSTAS